jgi:hypothetical protein
MDILVVVAIAETLRLVVLFFGTLESAKWGEVVVALTNPLTLPLGFEDIKTPYGGVFEIDAAVTIVIVLVVEWVLSVIRSRA